MNSDIDTLARTLWGEARGDGEAGMRAVASVVMNRAAHPGWWGNGIADICRKPWQFSCWDYGDPNLPQLLGVTPENAAFALALEISGLAVAGQLPDSTGGATCYYAKSLAEPPAWAAHMQCCAEIGGQLFFKEGRPL